MGRVTLKSMHCGASRLIWRYLPIDEKAAQTLADALDIDPILATLLVQRGCTEIARAEAFIRPSLKNLKDPFLLSHLKDAVERLALAIERRENVTILGDYDVDGITSAALCATILSKFGLKVSCFVPSRFGEGYGLTQGLIDRALLHTQPELMIVLDCGTNSANEVAFLKNNGIDTLILDHHSAQKEKPDCILVNPHASNVIDDVPFQSLCTVGLVFKVFHGLLKYLRERQHPLAHAVELKHYLDLVALGTVADLVPLSEENRIIVTHGLARFHRSQFYGISALLQSAGIEPGVPLAPSDIAFKLGPRINVCGRLEDAALPLEMLLTEDRERIVQIVGTLNELNKKRQEIEKTVFEHAKKQVRSEDAAIVLYAPEWHSGVVGIVASRLCREFHKPAVVLGEEGGYAKGSGRSVLGFSLIDALAQCAPLLHTWGGHPMAAGISLDPKNLDTFREQFNAIAEQYRDDVAKHATLDITYSLQAEQLTEKLIENVERLQPFGMGNPSPVFEVKGVRVQEIKRFGNDREHARITWQNNDAIQTATVWKSDAPVPPMDTNIRLAVRIGWNYWRGTRTPKIEVVDWCKG